MFLSYNNLVNKFKSLKTYWDECVALYFNAHSILGVTVNYMVLSGNYISKKLYAIDSCSAIYVLSNDCLEHIYMLKIKDG